MSSDPPISEPTHVFYSWQSDLPGKTNRGLIEAALEAAAKKIGTNGDIDVQPVIDRDTMSVSGSPDISQTIFGKIERARLFVADVSIINHEAQSDRKTCNPNVLIELGFAAAKLGWNRVVCIFNEAFGSIDDLPFDLRTRRIERYWMQKSDAPATARNALAKRFEMIFSTDLVETTSPAEDPFAAAMNTARAAITNNTQGRAARIREVLDVLEPELEALRPDNTGGFNHEALVAAINRSADLQKRWASLCRFVATDGDPNCVVALLDWFRRLRDRYQFPPDKNGRYFEGDFDLYKFLGHEGFTLLTTMLLNESRWDMLQVALTTKWRHETSQGIEHEDFRKLCEFVELLDRRGRPMGRMSFHADLLKERYEGQLTNVCTWSDFMNADALLCFKGFLLDRSGLHNWRLWTSCYVSGRVPAFMPLAKDSDYAQSLATALGTDVEGLRSIVEPMLSFLRTLWRSNQLWRPGGFDPQEIASK